MATNGSDGYTLDDLEESAFEQGLEPRALTTPQQRGLENIREIEDEILVDAVSVVRETMEFRNVDPAKQLEGPPDEWIRELGPEEATRRFRMAMSGWLPTSQAPSGAKMAGLMVLGILKARSNESRPQYQLRVGTINMGVPQLREDTPVKVIEADDDT